MADKFQNKYRIPSARASWWNYGNEAAYFITICTANRVHYFGEIVESAMQLSEVGKIVEIEWLKTPSIRPDMNLRLGAFVVMPNHLHGVIWIGENSYNSPAAAVETRCIASLPSSQATFGAQSKNLASIVRGFKSAVTIFARKNNVDFAWQPRFHDHIIRNKDGYERIVQYIAENPVRWNEDTFYSA